MSSPVFKPDWVMAVFITLVSLVWLYLGYSALSIAKDLARGAAPESWHMPRLYLLPRIMGWAIIILATLHVAAGVEVLRSRRRGLIIALVVAVLSLPLAPVGPIAGAIIGIYAYRRISGSLGPSPA